MHSAGRSPGSGESEVGTTRVAPLHTILPLCGRLAWAWLHSAEFLMRVGGCPQCPLSTRTGICTCCLPEILLDEASVNLDSNSLTELLFRS